MKQQFIRFSAMCLLFSVAVIGCKKDDHAHDEEELITTVNVRLTESGTTNVTTFTFRDTDGPGGNAPTRFDTIRLAPNRTYNCEITLLNESVTPAEDKTPEIRTEANDHQFFFAPTSVNITVSNLDTDSRSLPLGLTSRWTTAAATPAGVTGSIRVTLKHKPGIKASGDDVSKGETDIEVAFPAVVR
jgi:hypothetical protein